MVRHCGRPPPARRPPARRLGPCTPGPPPVAPRRPCRPSPGPRPPSCFPAGLSSPPLPSSFAASRPGAAATREPRRRSGSGPSREPRGVRDAGAAPGAPPRAGAGRGGVGARRGQGATALPLPGPLPGSIVSGRDRGPGFRVRSLFPPGPGEGETLPALLALLRSRLQQPSGSRQFARGGVSAPFPFPVTSQCVPCFWKMSFTG